MNSDERECDPYWIGNCLTGRKYPNHHQPQLSRPGTALSVGTSLGRTESEARFEEETKAALKASMEPSSSPSVSTEAKREQVAALPDTCMVCGKPTIDKHGNPQESVLLCGDGKGRAVTVNATSLALGSCASPTRNGFAQRVLALHLLRILAPI